MVRVSRRPILTLTLTLTLNSDYTTLLVISWNNWFHNFTVTYVYIIVHSDVNIEHSCEQLLQANKGQSVRCKFIFCISDAPRGLQVERIDLVLFSGRML